MRTDDLGFGITGYSKTEKGKGFDEPLALRSAILNARYGDERPELVSAGRGT
jgi:hypothetical protein